MRYGSAGEPGSDSTWYSPGRTGDRASTRTIDSDPLDSNRTSAADNDAVYDNVSATASPVNAAANSVRGIEKISRMRRGVHVRM
jgi:hypothetical protein